MKVLGQLEGAQLEQIAATSTTPASTGRIYIDVTAPLAAIPMVFNGTAWRALALTQSAAVAANSSTSVTVNWATGLTQKVTLTNNCKISFSNPQAGQVHTLIVVQNNSSLTLGTGKVYLYTLDLSDQAARRTPYQPPTVLGLGESRVHKWYYEAGIQSGYATIPSATFAPFTAPATAQTAAAMSSDGQAITLGLSGSPFNATYRLNPDAALPNIGPWGASNVATPATAAATIVGAAYHPSNLAIFLVSGTSPYIQGFMCDRYISAGSAFANPGTLPTGAGRCIAVHPSGNYVGVGHTTTPFMSIYPWKMNVYGTILANPSTLPAAAVTALAWSPQGDYLAAACQTTPFIQVYAFTDNSGAGTIGAKSADPTLPTGGPAGSLGKGIAWRPQGDYIAMAMTTSPYIYCVPFSRSTGVFGTPLAITSNPGVQVNAVQWSPCGQYLVAVGSSTGLWVYDFSSFTLGTPLAFDGSAPGAQVNDVCIHPSGEYFTIHMNTGAATAWAMPRKTKNYLKLLE